MCKKILREIQIIILQVFILLCLTLSLFSCLLTGLATILQTEGVGDCPYVTVFISNPFSVARC